LARELGRKGVRTWVDEAQILVGDSPIAKIDNAISKTRFFVVVLSKDSLERSWVKKELEMAITREITEKRFTILPALIGECELPLYLRTKRYADFRQSEEKGLQDLLQALVGRSHFQCMLFRQTKAALPRRGMRQRIDIQNYSGITYKGEKVAVVTRDAIEPGICYFALNVKNLTDRTIRDTKVTVKPVDSTKKITDCWPQSNTRIMSGGVNLNFVSYNIPLLHPYDDHHFAFATNTDVWPEVEILCESCIWDGRISKFDIIPKEHESVMS
jgi:hypothetical protein